jgi:flagellar basal-body rod protein FlgB
MNMIDKALGVHEKALGMRNQRMEVLSRNIANADTPNFKAQDLDFKALLKDTQDFAMKTSQRRHKSEIPRSV